MSCGDHAEAPFLSASGARDQTPPHTHTHIQVLHTEVLDWVSLFRGLQQVEARTMAGKKLAEMQGIGSIPDMFLFVLW